MSCAFDKDPDAILDYYIDWSDWLTGSEVLASSTWTVPTGIVKDSDGNSDTVTQIWLSGGTVGRVYRVINHIKTNSSPVREDDRTLTIRISEK